MAEYIEREAAIAAAFSATSLGNSAFRDVYDTVNRLRLIPTASVQPMRHGRWIENEAKQEKYMNFIRKYWNCSECGIEICSTLPVFDLSKWCYCPNCGAKMDGGET